MMNPRQETQIQGTPTWLEKKTENGLVCMVRSWIAHSSAHGSLDSAVLEFSMPQVPEKILRIARHVPKRRGFADWERRSPICKKNGPRTSDAVCWIFREHGSQRRKGGSRGQLRQRESSLLTAFGMNDGCQRISAFLDWISGRSGLLSCAGSQPYVLFCLGKKNVCPSIRRIKFLKLVL